jgi:F0F1-type ATP synthase membrane subunit b/b'
MEIIRQLGELFLQAVPTVIIVFLFYLFMRWAFFTPIQKAMAERSAKMEGARAEAASVEAAAHHDLENYHAALRKAQGEIYFEQEEARQAVLDERAKNLKAQRSLARNEVDEAKRRIAAELAEARKEVERQTPELAGAIARSILAGGNPSRGGARQ